MVWKAHQQDVQEGKEKPYFIIGDRNTPKLGPISLALAEEKMRQYRLAYEKRHGHPYPQTLFYGASDSESTAWLKEPTPQTDLWKLPAIIIETQRWQDLDVQLREAIQDGDSRRVIARIDQLAKERKRGAQVFKPKRGQYKHVKYLDCKSYYDPGKLRISPKSFGFLELRGDHF